jgi:hypothetical protein
MEISWRESSAICTWKHFWVSLISTAEIKGEGGNKILRRNRWGGGGGHYFKSRTSSLSIFFFVGDRVDIAYRTVAIYPCYNTKWWWTTASLFHCRVSKEGPILYKVCAPFSLHHNTFDTLYILYNVVLNTNWQFKKKKKLKIKTYLVWPRVDDCSNN